MTPDTSIIAAAAGEGARCQALTRATCGCTALGGSVLDRGVLYKRKRYRSLSEVARLITGSRWSGPLFFGLRGKRQQETSRGTKGQRSKALRALYPQVF